jgi:hypothetical protein
MYAGGILPHRKFWHACRPADGVVQVRTVRSGGVRADELLPVTQFSKPAPSRATRSGFTLGRRVVREKLGFHGAAQARCRDPWAARRSLAVSRV